MSGDVVKKAMAGELVGEVVGFMHPTAEWCHRNYSAVSAHCQIGGPAPVSLIRQSEAAELIASQAAEIEQLKKERDGLFNSGIGTVAKLCAAEYSISALATRAETAERLLAEARAKVVSLPVHTRDDPDDAYGVNSVDYIPRKEALAILSTLTNGGENGR